MCKKIVSIGKNEKIVCPLRKKKLGGEGISVTLQHYNTLKFCPKIYSQRGNFNKNNAMI